MEEANNTMDAEVLTAKHQLSIPHRLISAVVPVLLISVGYVDPGKLAAVVEGGARFGSDLIAPMLIFNLAAIVFQYLSVRIAVVKGKNLAQICSKEYDKVTCIILGIQAELSMISLDLTKILGTAHWLNLIFGADLFTCVFLTSIEAILFPLVATFLENSKAKFLVMCTASSMLVLYVSGVLISQNEISLSFGGMLTKLSGESAFMLMSLLGASVMPHNFYLHSSIVQNDQTQIVVSKEASCQDHLCAILCVFSGIFLVYCVLMNSAANAFYSTAFGLLTFQDALSVMDQMLKSSVAPFTLILVMFLSNQITALTWNLGRQVVLYDLLGLDIPGWLHHVTIRLFAIIPALYCVYNSGGEGIYQLLIFTQVVVALVLPASVIPLFRIASSRSIMGIYKVSQLFEFISLMMFIGMVGLKILFVVEMILGDTDWVINLRWNMETISFVPFAALLVFASFSLSLMLWLAAIPLRSESSGLDVQEFNWDMQTSGSKSYAERNESHFNETEYCVDEPTKKKETTFGLDKSLRISLHSSSTTPNLNLPDTLLDSEVVPQSTTIEANCSDMFPSPCSPEESLGTVEKVLVSTVCSKVSDSVSQDGNASIPEPKGVIEETVRIEGELQNKKDEEGSILEPDESSKGISVSNLSLTSEGPGSFRSLSGKSDDAGSGTGSLPRLAGLGRSARCQLTAVLNEFWGQVFNFHGQVTQKAGDEKLDILLGIKVKVDTKVDPRPTPASLKVGNYPKESAGYFQAFSRTGSDPLMKSNLSDPFMQQRGQSCMEPSYGVQRGTSSPWSSHMQLLDAYVQNSSCNALDSGERRYSSLRLPPTSDSYDNQPATIHGCEIASYLNRIAKERNSDHLNGELKSQYPKLSSLLVSGLTDSVAFNLGQKPQSGLNTCAPPGFSNIAVSRNNSLQRGSPVYNLCALPSESMGNTVNTKKYCSLPDISGLSHPLRDPLFSERTGYWNKPLGYGQSLDHTVNERSLYSSCLRAGPPSAVDEFSPSKVCRDAFSWQLNSSSDAKSLWSKQPSEQFGAVGKYHSHESEEIVGKKGSLVQQTTLVDVESRLLQSFRNCVVKLLKLEGCDWLFRQNDGADEDLIDRVAARERFIDEVETRERTWVDHMGESQVSSDRRLGLTHKHEADYTPVCVTSVPHCGEGCIWKVDLITSFGVWCIHRVLELSLMESRPELWGKYTYVLNRLQGIIDLAFSRPRSPMNPCFCLQIPKAYQQRFSPPMLNGSLPPPAKLGKGKCTTAAMLLDIIKDVEIAISSRKGRTGTAAGDVAFPKGKENLVSVLKRYKRRLANKPVGNHDDGSGSRKFSPHGS